MARDLADADDAAVARSVSALGSEQAAIARTQRGRATILYGLPSAIALALVRVLGAFVWLWAAICVRLTKF